MVPGRYVSQGYSWLQIHPSQQVLEARVVAEGVAQPWILCWYGHTHIPAYHDHPLCMLPFGPPSSNSSITTMRWRYFILL